MSATFPPGPYEIGWRKTKHPSWELRAADGRILTSSSTIIPEDEIEGLGRLLKAAPDLIEALEAVGVMPEGYCFCSDVRDATKPEEQHQGECRVGRAAIAKVRG